jgi:hypothetical protein
MKTEIGHLQLSLPAGMEKRAARIGRLVAQALARQHGLPAGRIATLPVGPLRIDPRRPDHALAQGIAGAIAQAIGSQVKES